MNAHLGHELGSKCRDAKGQVAVIFALVFTFMFVLFAFVVDFAHLVNNKINLQLAADMAAYSGAAYQAHTMNRISMANYRMRQNLKEMSMRMNVTHAQFNYHYPDPSAITGPPTAAPDDAFNLCVQAHGYQSIAGVNYQPKTNLCKNANPATGGLPPIVVPQLVAFWDPVAVALVAQITRIQQAADQECTGAANDNRELANHLKTVFLQRNLFHQQQIQTMADLLNSTGGTGSYGSPPTHPIARVAFESAVHNLTRANRDQFHMEVIPVPQYIDIQPQNMDADVVFWEFKAVNGGCVAQPNLSVFSMPVGVNKTEETITYFGVKVTARPKMLFMPEPWVNAAFPEIRAISMAKPFGSRIGPPQNFDKNIPQLSNPGVTRKMVNFSFTPGDQLGMRNAKVLALLSAMHHRNSLGYIDGNEQTGWPEPSPNNLSNDPLTLIRAPTMFEAALYSIFPDPNRGQDYQESVSVFPDFMEWGSASNVATLGPAAPAPYFNSQSSNDTGNVQGYIPVYTPNVPGATSYYGNGVTGNLRYAFEQPGSHSVAVASNLGIPFINDSTAADFGFANVEQVHSGWGPNKGGGSPPGRLGYSVKFVSVDLITRTMVVNNPAGGTSKIKNLPSDIDQYSQSLH